MLHLRTRLVWLDCMAASLVQVYFAAAMEAEQYEAAMDVLDPLERTPDTDAQWSQLGAAALTAVASGVPALLSTYFVKVARHAQGQSAAQKCSFHADSK